MNEEHVEREQGAHSEHSQINRQTQYINAVCPAAIIIEGALARRIREEHPEIGNKKHKIVGEE